MPARRTALWTGATLLLCGGLWWAWAAQAPGARAAVRLSPAAAQDATTVGARPAPPNAVAALQPDPTRTQRSVAQVRQALFERGSLRGVQPDGGFRLDAQGRLMPDRAVRRRFDQLLTTLGEATIEELGDLLQQQARAELGGDDGAAQVMAVWERYLQLQRQLAPAGGTSSPPTADSLALALQERARQRRLVLGNDWAEAFYGEEEAALQARLSSDAEAASPAPGRDSQATTLPSAARAPQPGEDLAALQRQREATLGPEAAARLQALDQAQAAWAQKVAEARSQVTRLQGAAELSAVQRQQAIDQLIESRFAPQERLRARAVLGLAPVGG